MKRISQKILKRQCMLRLLVLIVLVLLSPAAKAQDSDADGDGRSDVILVSKSGSQLRWSAAVAATSFGASTTDLSNFGDSESSPFIGYWTSADALEVGAVSISGRSLRWSVQPASGQAPQAIEFGAQGDTVLSGGDFDGNGLSDLARVGRNGEVQIFLNPFAAGTVQSLSIAKKISRRSIPFFYRSSGTFDELGFLEFRGKKRRKQVSLARLSLAGVVTTEDWGRMNSAARRVLPVQGTQGRDNLFIVLGSRGNSFEVRAPEGGIVLTRGKVTKGATPLVGDFLPIAGEEVAFAKSGQLTVINPESGVPVVFSGMPSADQYVDLVSVGRLVPSGSKKGGDSGGGQGLSAACPGGTRRVSSGFLWKPDADAKLGPPRSGKPVILFQTNKPGSSSIDIVASDGTKVCSAGFKASSERGINCNSDHYYVGWSGGCGLTDGGIAAAARSASGSSTIYVRGRGGVCYGPINPPSRQGGIGC